MPFPYEEFDLSGVRTYPLASRPSKARVEDFARPVARGASFKAWFDSLPAILGGQDLRRAVRAMVDARARSSGIIWGLGAHVIKTGVSPVVIDLMRRGWVSAVAMNGAGIIHDFEIALSGATSEDVDESLGPGRFGMASETGELLNQVIRRGVERRQGLGQAVAAFLAERHPPHADRSLAVAAHRLGIPLTVHVAIGTDITHMHPAASGAAIGEASLRDFRYFTSCVGRLNGGVYLNCGSAVVLPEVFLKAVALVRNQGIALDGLTTVNIDFLRMYRPQTNVVTRPVAGTGGSGISLVGHHEILIPLLAAAAIELGPEA
ncbi:MAG: deoxyhypusine synthase family protein [Acidobacteria bacterium]|nr:deoxyhypusine synthase family protein [Acidobacteriota bacterium]